MKVQKIGEILVMLGIAILLSNLIRSSNYSECCGFLLKPSKEAIEGFRLPPRNIRFEVNVKGGSIDLYFLSENDFKKMKEGKVAYIKYFHNITSLQWEFTVERGNYFILIKPIKFTDNEVFVEVYLTLYGIERDMTYIGFSLISVGIALVCLTKVFKRANEFK
ncbi:MAG: hypothetical protein DRN04_12925 [Thermoprotei archaeon]|nr:MAG: hypothetical protein DRN04_12925 [Thermoprotei archaeon]